ncbi:D-alanine--D-alanine ligase [Paenibacillus campi]|uniref:D-alanine--D-alanine ligase n=1 Tax=Paenibacillus campi TaxID=3106031 RepID=UPI002AFEE1BD|nr:D-alanine--D-alanine ligase [Paenibacillus sp. SGZ-1009]
MTATKLTVGLIYGGKSGEHEVSLQTAFSVMNALDYGKYDAVPVYIDKQGRWNMGQTHHAAPAHLDQLQLDGGEQATAEAMNVLWRKLSGQASVIDVLFPLLHGTYGEDGTIQGLFEMMDMPYVGAGVLASAAGMDKAIMKSLFAQAGLPQCKYETFIAAEYEANAHDILGNIEHHLGFPCFVKPANLGSSVGISKARDRNELERAIQYALRFDLKVIVEEAVDAHEVEVGVLGNELPLASVPGEIVSSSDYYDYEAKYVDGNSRMIIPAEIDSELAENLRELALRAFKAIDGSGLCRADFFVRRSDRAIMINEVNTMPGFTAYSMYPLLWRETGKSYPELLDQLIQLGLDRYNKRHTLQFKRD